MTKRSSFEDLAQDIRFAFRTLRKAPGFTFVAVAALSIGIGGSVAIFSLVDSMRAGALPYDDASKLVQLWGNVQRTQVERRGNSYPDFLDWRAEAKSFEDMAAFDNLTLTLNTGDAPERIGAEPVSSPYFRLLGVEPAKGRTFLKEEDAVEPPTFVVILSDGLWKRRFGSDPTVVGRQVRIGTDTYSVIGVMPPRFRGVTDGAEMWVPFARVASASRGNRGFGALARLRPEVSVAAAQREMDTISKRLETAYPDTNAKRGVSVSPLETELFGAFRPGLMVLLAAVALVLLIACANVANLVLARSEARRREIAVRTALGARRARLFAQMITESCVLVIVSALVGLTLARGAVSLLISQSPVTFPSVVTPSLDWRVALFTVMVSLVCGVLVGLTPALQAQSVDLGGVLKETARGAEGRRAQRMRSGLVVAEVSLAVVLLVGAGLMIRSVRNLSAVDPGFDANSVLTLRVSVPRATVAAPAVQSAAAGAPTPAPPPPPPLVQSSVLIERLRAVPGVVAVALGTDLPLDGNASATFYSAEGMPAADAQTAPRSYTHRVTPDFFSTLRIPIRAGRTFTSEELTPTATVAIVSERVVERFWPGQDPIGKRVKFGPADSANPWLTVVGVVAEIKYRGVPQNPTADPDLYLPFAERNTQFGFAIRTSVPPSSVIEPLRAAIRETNSSIPIYSVAALDDLVRQQSATSRFTMWLMGVFAALALGLAVLGLYGVMAYLVTQRTREIGVRMALGAQRNDVVSLIVWKGARLVGVGLVTGLMASLALQRVVQVLFFGVGAFDISTVIAVAVLAVVAFVACYVPAVRAARISPLTALRYE